METLYIYKVPLILLAVLVVFGYIYKKKNKELKSLNAQFQLRSKFFDEIFRNSQDGIVLMDHLGRIINTNESFRRIFRVKDSELIG